MNARLVACVTFVFAGVFTVAVGDDRVSSGVTSDFEFSAPAALNKNFQTDSGADTLPAIATDGSGTWIAVWESKHNIRRRIGHDKDILYTVSTDSGETWSRPLWLNGNAKIDEGSDSSPDIIYVPAADSWLVAWQTDDSLGGTIGKDWDIVYAVSANGGASWTEPTHVDPNAVTDSGSDINVDLGCNGEWNILAVWQSNDSRGDKIGRDWDIIGASNAFEPAIPTGTWRTIGPANLDSRRDDFSDKNPSCAAAWSGPWHVVWERRVENGNSDIWRAQNNASGANGNWLMADQLSDSRLDERDPAVAVDLVNGDNVVVVWRMANGGDTDIWFSRSTNGAVEPPNWSVPTTLNLNAGNDSRDDRRPQIATDGTGGWLCVWESREDLDGVAGRDWDIFQSYSLDNGANWSATRWVNQDAGTDRGADRSPALVNDLVAPGFSSRANFSVSAQPYLATTGDINKDGHLDVVVPNLGSDTISVLLGGGNGSFANATHAAVGWEPIHLSLGDLNHDTWPDAVVANFRGNSISVLLGNGDGTFGPATQIAVGARPRTVQLVHLNADVHLDVVTANQGDDVVAVFLGNGDGTLGVKREFPLGGFLFPTYIVPGLLDGDTYVDLVVSTSQGLVGVFLGNGDGTFGEMTPYTHFGSASHVALGDMDSDGDLDIVTVRGAGDTLSVLLGNGDGTFGANRQFTVGTGPRSIALADVNNDSHLDAVTANSEDNDISVLLGDGTGVFSFRSDFDTENGPLSVVLGDFDEDASIDAAVTNFDSNVLSVLSGSTWHRRWHVVWESKEDRGDADRDYDVFVVRAPDHPGDAP